LVLPFGLYKKTIAMMTDWDAGTYHRLSGPQLAWGRRVAEKLAPRAGERILDLGCGTGRLTTELAARHPDVRFIGADVSHAMLTEARRASPRVAFVRADGAALPFAGAFDAIFSAATFHWILDHPALFKGVLMALKPGGRLVAQCGGGPNLERLLERAGLMDSAAFASLFQSWRDPWRFAGTEETRAILEQAGFTGIDVSLEPAPTTLPDRGAFSDFIACVCVRHHVDRLPPAARKTFVDALAGAAALDDPPFTLDYWRLNISARKRGPS
jgi:trans-aconitate 2-methyltransferase